MSNVTRTLARLLSRTSYAGPTAPRQVRAFAAPVERAKTRREEPARPHAHPSPPVARSSQRNAAVPAARSSQRNAAAPAARSSQRNVAAPAARPAQRKENGSFVPFRISWGKEQGADARRLLAVACRRGRDPGHQRRHHPRRARVLDRGDRGRCRGQVRRSRRATRSAEPSRPHQARCSAARKPCNPPANRERISSDPSRYKRPASRNPR